MDKVNLIILDGFGLAPAWSGNALTLAKMPNWNSWWRYYSHSTLKAHGRFVGLPDDEIGNSEVGHLTIGAGRLILQNSAIINEAIMDGSFFKNKTLLEAINICRDNDKPLHLMGLLTNSAVHASFNHLEALIRLASIHKVKEVYLHLFMDGRDTGNEDGIIMVERLNQVINNYKLGKISTMSGRYYAMDRDNRLERTKKAVDCLTEGLGDRSNSPARILSFTYGQNKSDEFVAPSVLVDEDKKPIGLIKDGDPIIFFNFRADRARQITECLAQKVPNSYFVTFTRYGVSSSKVKDSNVLNNVHPAFESLKIIDGLASYLSQNNINQFHIAETEKYAHVTYFFNSGIEEVYPGEERVIIPSPKVAVYDRTPKMSAPNIADNLMSILKQSKYQFTVTNFANADMVGHTGNLSAAQQAVEEIDFELGKVAETAANNGWYTIITADHGNVEEMVDPISGSINPEHTKNPVPFIIIPPVGQSKPKLKPNGTLADVAPTILDIFKLRKPEGMTGESLIAS